MRNRPLTIDTSSRVIYQIDDLVTPTTQGIDDKAAPNEGIEHKTAPNEEIEDKAASDNENQVNPITTVIQVTAEQDESNAASFDPDEFKPTDENEEEEKEEKETDTSLPRTCRFSFLPPSPSPLNTLTENSSEAKENDRSQPPTPGSF